jgi:predicted ATPase
MSEPYHSLVGALSEHCQNLVRSLSKPCQSIVRTMSQNLVTTLEPCQKSGLLKNHHLCSMVGLPLGMVV